MLDLLSPGSCALDLRESSLDRLDVDRAARMSKATGTSPTSLVVALLYLDRLRNRNPGYLRAISSADLFLVSLVSSCLITKVIRG